MRINKKLKARLSTIYYKFKFGKFGKRSVIIDPLNINGARNIYINENVVIESLSWIAAVPLTNTKDCKLEICSGSRIGHFNHIYATHYIKIGKDVLTSDRVYISDNSHDYSDIEKPILRSNIRQLNDVSIGEGSWIGENVSIIGACIGKHCVIGANAVVTKNIPDYSIAVGVPAKVIKKFDAITGKWAKVAE